ncbi:hypothetical protein K490DRAFT_9086, partial [Saccharata proteae CBS 121410]
AQATFSVPCQGCLGGEDDDSLLFDFQVFPSDQPCRVSNISLNDQQLTQHWSGIRANGQGSISSSSRATDEHDTGHELILSWETSCLYDNLPKTDESHPDHVAQVLTVVVKEVDGKAVEGSAGFTVSFRQLARQVELLRLATQPHPAAAEVDAAEDWRNPPAGLRLAPVDLKDLPDGFVRHGASIEDELAHLRDLESQEKEIQERIRNQKEVIKNLMRENSHSLTEELGTCDSISCILKTFIRKAHGAVRIIYIRFRPEHHPPPHEDAMAHSPPPYNGHASQAISAIHGEKAGPPPPEPPPFEGPEDHGPPPPFDAYGPPPHPFGPPPFGVASILGLACLFSFIHIQCCTLRQRTERRATREERRTARQYRRLARRHAWRKWWSGNDNDWERQQDYEEKRALILDQEDRLEEAMQEEIEHLRRAHNVVHDIVQAEEGRIRSSPPAAAPCLCHQNQHQHAHHHPHSAYSPVHAHAHMHTPPNTQHTTPGGAFTPQPLSRTSSLPSYKSDTASIDTDDQPPAYEEDADSSDVVVDGFREYTPSTTTAWTPESSVPDTSPRPSAETMRQEIESLGDEEDEE